VVTDESSIKVGRLVFCLGSQRAQFKPRPSRWESIHRCQWVLDWDYEGCGATGSNSLTVSVLSIASFCSLVAAVIGQDISRAESC